MKFLGHGTVGCQCVYCVGPNGGNKAMKKAIKKRGRQAAKKEVRNICNITKDSEE